MARFSLAAVLLTAALATADPASTPLAVPPGEALRRLARTAPDFQPATGEESALFEDARDGSLDRHTLDEACLMAGGVSDARARRDYRARLDRIEDEARKAVAGIESVTERGAKLLRFLHDGPMRKGFRAERTDLHEVLDTGEFNCVSSTALYVVLGRRLGLDARAVEVPEHMFVVLTIDGRTIDVETTVADGFDADPERRTGPAKAAARGGPPGTRREVDGPGLASVVAFNHGVALAGQKRYGEAVRANLVALSLDPLNPKAAQNAAAGLANWPVELAKGGKYPEAAAVLAAGKELAPKDPFLLNNARAVYDAWANVSVQRQDWSAAVRVYEAGLTLLPGDEHLSGNLAYCRGQRR